MLRSTTKENNMTDFSQAQRSDDYLDELPTDRAQTWSLLEAYSKIPPGEIESHLRAIVCPQLFPHLGIRTLANH